MAFKHGKDTKVFVNNSDFSTYFNNVDSTQMADVAESTTFGNGAKTYISGNKDGTMTITGFFDATADATLQPLMGGADFDLFVGYDGTTNGNQCAFGVGNITNYAVSSPVGDVVATSVDVQSDNGFFNGKLNFSGSDTTSGVMGSVVDDSSSSTNGFGAIVVCTSVSGTSPTFDIKVQHSADNVTYADLITFTQITAASSEVKVVASGTTVNRYIRVFNTIGGSSTPTFNGFVALARTR